MDQTDALLFHVLQCLSFNAIMEELGISLKNQKKLKKKSRTKGKSSFTSILTCHQRRTQRKETMAWARNTPGVSVQEEKHAPCRFLEKWFLTTVQCFPYIYMHNSDYGYRHKKYKSLKSSELRDWDYLGSGTDSFEMNLYAHLFYLFSFIPINCCVCFLNNNTTTGFFSRMSLSVGLFSITCSDSQCLVSKCYQLSSLLFWWIFLSVQPDKAISGCVKKKKIFLVCNKYLVFLVELNHSSLCFLFSTLRPREDFWRHLEIWA